MRQVIAVNNADIRRAQTDLDGIEQVRRELARLYLSGADYEALRRLTDLVDIQTVQQAAKTAG